MQDEDNTVLKGQPNRSPSIIKNEIFQMTEFRNCSVTLQHKSKMLFQLIDSIDPNTPSEVGRDVVKLCLKRAIDTYRISPVDYKELFGIEEDNFSLLDTKMYKLVNSLKYVMRDSPELFVPVLNKALMGIGVFFYDSSFSDFLKDESFWEKGPQIRSELLDKTSLYSENSKYREVLAEVFEDDCVNEIYIAFRILICIVLYKFNNLL